MDVHVNVNMEGEGFLPTRADVVPTAATAAASTTTSSSYSTSLPGEGKQSERIVQLLSSSSLLNCTSINDSPTPPTSQNHPVLRMSVAPARVNGSGPPGAVRGSIRHSFPGLPSPNKSNPSSSRLPVDARRPTEAGSVAAQSMAIILFFCDEKDGCCQCMENKRHYWQNR